jgi:hypothetical protein
MPTVQGVDPNDAADCQPVTELYVYMPMNQEWTKYETGSGSSGSSNMDFVMATGGLKEEQAGQSVYAELQFEE